jgi:Lon protease-like protein
MILSQLEPDELRALSHRILVLARGRIVAELPPARNFREAQVEIYEDEYPNSAAATRAKLQRRLATSFKKILPHLAEARRQLDEILSSNLPLGVLTDIVSYTLDLHVSVKEQLLAECNVDRRAILLLDHLAEAAKDTTSHGPKGFPPNFSEN